MATVNSPQGWVQFITPQIIPHPESADGLRLVSFLNPHIGAPNSHNNTHQQILSWDDDKLDTDRDYIHWLFPLPFAVPADPTCPVLDQQTLIHIRSSDEILGNMRLSFVRMMAMYGFNVRWLENDENRLSAAHSHLTLTLESREQDSQTFQRWLKAADVNHQRILRMILSLRLFGLIEEAEKLAEAFFHINDLLGQPVSQQSLNSWQQGLDFPLAVISQGLLNFQPQFYAPRFIESIVHPELLAAYMAKKGGKS